MASTDPTTLPLSSLNTGDTGVLHSISLSQEITAQLERLGLAPGRKVKLIKHGNRCLLGVAGARFALDRELASQIFVS